jgi:glycosyltransferase involved in cell wall biosynthesis
MWETDTLPVGAVRLLNRCGLVIVPSRWGAACFRANGVRVPTEVVPLGYDPATFGRDSRAIAPPRVAAKQVVFGTAGALDEGGLRKNVQRVIDLFRAAFPAEPNVRLRVKVTPNSPPVTTHGDPRIEVIGRALSAAELADWYRSLTAYVNASFGEGFGLHLLEAMACGVPLISTTFGGPGQFFDSRVGYEVPFRLVTARNTVYGGQWADPDDGHLVARMRQVSRNRHEARGLGQRAAERALRFRWEDTTRRLVIALIRHGFIRPAPTAGPPGAPAPSA